MMALRRLVLLVCVNTVAACRPGPPADAQRPAVTPVYDQATGRLAELVSDRDGDGRADTRAFMDGTRIVRVEIDRDGDGQVDRWEHYRSTPGTPQRAAQIDRAEEASRPGASPTRLETFEAGVLARVETDTDGDGRMDKWETYRGGKLAIVEMDTGGRGTADRRLTYGPDGRVTAERIQSAGTH